MGAYASYCRGGKWWCQHSREFDHALFGSSSAAAPTLRWMTGVKLSGPLFCNRLTANKPGGIMTPQIFINLALGASFGFFCSISLARTAQNQDQFREQQIAEFAFAQGFDV